jgi:hypothetical protein
MKRFFIFLVALLALNSANGQSCLPEGITFNTQSQIDSFQTNYPNCTQIEGGVTITGGGITNLNGLSVMTSIGGDLVFYENPSLTSLTGLENVTSIGGDLNLSFNHALVCLIGLDGLTSIEGSLNIFPTMTWSA